MTAIIEQQTAEKIHFAIEKKLTKGSSYIDALVEYASENNIEIETVAAIVKKSSLIKEKIREEASKKRLLKEDDNHPSARFFK